MNHPMRLGRVVTTALVIVAGCTGNDVDSNSNIGNVTSSDLHLVLQESVTWATPLTADRYETFDYECTDSVGCDLRLTIGIEQETWHEIGPWASDSDLSHERGGHVGHMLSVVLEDETGFEHTSWQLEASVFGDNTFSTYVEDVPAGRYTLTIRPPQDDDAISCRSGACTGGITPCSTTCGSRLESLNYWCDAPFSFDFALSAGAAYAEHLEEIEICAQGEVIDCTGGSYGYRCWTLDHGNLELPYGAAECGSPCEVCYTETVAR